MRLSLYCSEADIEDQVPHLGRTSAKCGLCCIVFVCDVLVLHCVLFCAVVTAQTGTS